MISPLKAVLANLRQRVVGAEELRAGRVRAFRKRVRRLTKLLGKNHQRPDHGDVTLVPRSPAATSCPTVTLA